MDFITKQKVSFWLVVILILLNLTTLAVLWSRRGPPRLTEPRPGPGDRTFVSDLNLTREQESRFEELRDEYFDVIRRYTAQINSKKHELMETLFQDELDNQKLNALADELGQLNAQLEKDRFEQILKFKTTLTDSQFNIFKRIVDEAYKPRPGEMDRRGPPPKFDAPCPGNSAPPPGSDDRRPDEMSLPPPAPGDGL